MSLVAFEPLPRPDIAVRPLNSTAGQLDVAPFWTFHTRHGDQSDPSDAGNPTLNRCGVLTRKDCECPATTGPNFVIRAGRRCPVPNEVASPYPRRAWPCTEYDNDYEHRDDNRYGQIAIGGHLRRSYTARRQNRRAGGIFSIRSTPKTVLNSSKYFSSTTPVLQTGAAQRDTGVNGCCRPRHDPLKTSKLGKLTHVRE